MTDIMKLLYTFCAIMGVNLAVAQTPLTFNRETNHFLQDVSGRPLFLQTAHLEEGDHAIPAANCYAKIILLNGRSYDNVLGRMELLHKEFVFTDEKGNDLLPDQPAKRIEFANCDPKRPNMIFQRGYLPVDKQSQESFYEVLFEGKDIELLRYHEATYRDDKPYNSATVTRKYTIRSTYYLSSGKLPRKIAKDRSEIIRSLKNAKALDLYIGQEKLDLKKDKDLIRLLEYHETLK